MKKNYIIPTTKSIVLNFKESMLQSTSISEEEGEEFDTRKQQSGSSLWDNWNSDN